MRITCYFAVIHCTRVSLFLHCAHAYTRTNLFNTYIHINICITCLRHSALIDSFVVWYLCCASSVFILFFHYTCPPLIKTCYLQFLLHHALAIDLEELMCTNGKARAKNVCMYIGFQRKRWMLTELKCACGSPEKIHR